MWAVLTFYITVWHIFCRFETAFLMKVHSPLRSQAFVHWKFSRFYLFIPCWPSLCRLESNIHIYDMSSFISDVTTICSQKISRFLFNYSVLTYFSIVSSFTSNITNIEKFNIKTIVISLSLNNFSTFSCLDIKHPFKFLTIVRKLLLHFFFFEGYLPMIFQITVHTRIDSST